MILNGSSVYAFIVQTLQKVYVVVIGNPTCVFCQNLFGQICVMFYKIYNYLLIIYYISYSCLNVCISVKNPRVIKNYFCYFKSEINKFTVMTNSDTETQINQFVIVSTI